MLVEFTREELQELNEMAQQAHAWGYEETPEWKWSPRVLAKALDALARYQKAERVAAENEVTGVHRLRTRPRE